MPEDGEGLSGPGGLSSISLYPLAGSGVLILVRTLLLPVGATQEPVGSRSRFCDLIYGANRWDLLAAAYLLGDGFGADGFDCFRECLISLGRERFYRALENPDALAEISQERDVPFLFADGFGVATWRAYENVTGEPLYDSDVPLPPKELTGSPIDLSDELALRNLLPRLYAAKVRLKLPRMLKQEMGWEW